MVSGSRACLTSILSDHPHRPSPHFDGALGCQRPDPGWPRWVEVGPRTLRGGLPTSSSTTRELDRHVPTVPEPPSDGSEP